MLETISEVIDQVGVTPYSNSYPKVNVYEYDDKVGIVVRFLVYQRNKSKWMSRTIF